MTLLSPYDEERLAAMLRRLPPAPAAWVRAAQELPTVRRDLDAIVARAEADRDFHAALIADLESALAAEGYQPDRALVQVLRARLIDS
jgi:hypothetical protein